MLVFYWIYLCIFTLSTINADNSFQPPEGRYIACYVKSWAVFRKGEGRFSYSDIDPRLCTHLMYAFAGLHETDHVIVSRSPYGDYEANYGLGGYRKAIALKEKYPHLKVLLSVGGHTEGSIKFSKMAAQASTRRLFVESVLNLFREYKFDGLDVCWNYPGVRGGSKDDRINFPLLLQDLRQEFNKTGLLLTALVVGKRYYLNAGTDLKVIARHLDWINLVTYDYNGPWENKTCCNSPLRSEDMNNVEHSVNLLLEAEVPRDKILIGIPSYGHTFIMLANTDKPSFNLPTSAASFMGEFTLEEGFIGFNEICRELKQANNPWRRYWDDLSETPFLVNGLRFISYDDKESVTRKVKFLMEKCLKGAFLESLDTDDFRNTCSLPAFLGDSGSAFPVLTAIHLAMRDLSCTWNTSVYSHKYGD